MLDLYVLYVCDGCGAYDFAAEEIGHRGHCRGRRDGTLIKRLTLMPVAEEPAYFDAA